MRRFIGLATCIVMFAAGAVVGGGVVNLTGSKLDVQVQNGLIVAVGAVVAALLATVGASGG